MSHCSHRHPQTTLEGVSVDISAGNKQASGTVRFSGNGVCPRRKRVQKVCTQPYIPQPQYYLCFLTPLTNMHTKTTRIIHINTYVAEIETQVKLATLQTFA